MSDFIVIRNIKSPFGDVSISDDKIDENAEYSLLVDVSLHEVREKKNTGEDEPDKMYVFLPIGDIRLVNLTKARERIKEEQRKAESLSN